MKFWLWTVSTPFIYREERKGEQWDALKVLQKALSVAATVAQTIALEVLQQWISTALNPNCLHEA